MAIPYLPGGLVTVTRNRYPLTEDEYLNETRDLDATPDSLPVSGCSFQPSTGAEFVVDADRFTERADLYLPPTADIVGTDLVGVPDRGEWAVDGPVERWPDVGGLGHVHVRLVRFREAVEYTIPEDGGGAEGPLMGTLDGGTA